MDKSEMRNYALLNPVQIMFRSCETREEVEFQVKGKPENPPRLISVRVDDIKRKPDDTGWDWTGTNSKGKTFYGSFGDDLTGVVLLED